MLDLSSAPVDSSSNFTGAYTPDNLFDGIGPNPADTWADNMAWASSAGGSQWIWVRLGI